MEHFTLSHTDVIVRMFVAMLLGGTLGIERSIAGKTAGIRTYALVSMGSAVFILISISVSQWYVGMTNFDPLRMAAQIVAGLGFIGAGMIIFKGSQVNGLTTAAGLWVASGIGMATGFGLYEISLFATALALFTFSVLWFLKRRIQIFSHNHSLDVHHDDFDV